MKKIFFVLLFICFPFQGFADLDIFLSDQNLSYGEDVWTSDSTPDSWSDNIKIDINFSREEFSPAYERSNWDIKDLLDDLFSDLSVAQQQSMYESLMSFDSGRLAPYFAISISADSETNISDKQSMGYLLTSFESIFQSCWIDLSSRRAIARSLIEDIHDGTYSKADELQYDDIRFGDCIIPYPDTRRGTTSIADSFESNKLIATTLGWNPLVFSVLEDSVNLFSLSNITLDGTYAWVQSSNLLDLSSNRIEQDETFPKEVWKEKILYVHQNYYKNIFKDSIITGDSTSGYMVGWVSFNWEHPLSILSSESEENRTLSWWQEVEDGIYSKTLIQEDTFTISGWVYIPKQNVWVTTYYAILYNYDITAPVCPVALFSHENSGNENFILPANPWFWVDKYGYFVCSDEQSGCLCDSASVWCFVRDDRVLSLPQKVPHAWGFQSNFENNVDLTALCESPLEAQLYYDKISPEVHISLPWISDSSLEKEYVTNNGVQLNWQEITSKRLYHIKNDMSFIADNNLEMSLEIHDRYDSSDMTQWVSWLSWYDMSIAKFEDDSWINIIHESDSFDAYNPLWNITATDSETIELHSFDTIEDVFTKTWEYQVILNAYDAANNHTMMVFYFEIIPWDIDVVNSLLSVVERDNKYANNNDYYQYSLSLKDTYFNPIAWRDISNVLQSCVWIINCWELKLDMSWPNPSWSQALDIFDIDSVSDMNGEINFSVRSKAPWSFTESFEVSTNSPNESFRFILENNSFLAPYVGTLQTKISWFWESDLLLVDELAEYRIQIEDLSSMWNIWSYSDFSSQIRARHPDTLFTLATPITTLWDSIYFSGIFSSSLSESEKHKTLLEIADWPNSAIIISYSLGWSTVSYRLSRDTVTSQILDLSNSWELTNPVKIIWNLQWVGNTQNLSERQNITNLDTYTSRNAIRKNIWNIHMRQNNSTVWGVKYIDKTSDFNKNYTLEANPDFETLIVRNGNILIWNDFNMSKKNVGIISYIDGGYNKETWFESIGNIYVESDVTTVNAMMYADGWLISTVSWNPVSWDKGDRNNILKNQLSIFGSLFTRNTLAWAVESEKLREITLRISEMKILKHEKIWVIKIELIILKINKNFQRKNSKQKTQNLLWNKESSMSEVSL